MAGIKALADGSIAQPVWIVDGSGIATSINTGAGSFATGQVPITTSGNLIAALRGNRRTIMIVNMSTVSIFLGSSTSVTIANGLFLPGLVGASIVLDTTADVYGVVASGSAQISFVEIYG